MAYVNETDGFVEGIRQFETTDPIEGGADGVDNIALSQLASRTRWLKDLLDATKWSAGDIKEVACTEDYIIANFNSTGLGLTTGERNGWAICNGQNGTIDKGGRVGVGRGTGYSMGDAGGNKDAAVISHTHTTPSVNVTLPRSAADNGETNGNLIMMSNVQAAGSVAFTSATSSSNTGGAGVSGIDRNMQPYIVTLFIQKL